MSAETARNAAPEQENDLRPEWKILIPTLVVLFCIIVSSDKLKIQLATG